MVLIKKQNNKTNVSIQLLRFLLCFWVVIIHCTYVKPKYKKYMFRGFHVPTFIFIAFYFYYPLLSKRNIIKIISRFQRLLIPYLLWPIIQLIILHLSLKKFKFGVMNFINQLSLKKIYLQILIGTQIYGIFWFQFNLIFLSLFFTIVSFMFKKSFLIILQFIGIISLYLRASQLDYYFFISFSKYISANLASLIELIPNAAIGCSLSHINFLIKIKNIPNYYKFMLALFAFIFFKYDIFLHLNGYRYTDVFLHMVMSIILFTLFGCIDLDKLKCMKPIINQLSGFTGGIYCIHLIIKNLLIKNFEFFNNGNNKTYFFSILIYILSYFICFIGYKLFENHNLKYLFI